LLTNTAIKQCHGTHAANFERRHLIIARVQFRRRAILIGKTVATPDSESDAISRQAHIGFSFAGSSGQPITERSDQQAPLADTVFAFTVALTAIIVKRVLG
jgi:hypothetical protein